MDKVKLNWLYALDNLIKNKETVCPYCGSKKLDYTVNEIKENRGYAAAWCEECKTGIKNSRMDTTNLATNREIPTGIKFL